MKIHQLFKKFKTIEARFNNTEIKSLPTDFAIEIVPAINGIIIPILTVMRTQLFGNGYGNISDDFPNSLIYLAYGDDSERASDASGLLLFSDSEVALLRGPAGITLSDMALGVQSVNVNVVGTPLKLVCFNTAGDFTGGNAADYLSVTTNYVEVSL